MRPVDVQDTCVAWLSGVSNTRRALLVLLATVVVFAVALAVKPPITDPALSHELIAMNRENDDLRGPFIGRVDPGVLSGLPQSVQDQFRDAARLERKHTNRLKEIVAKHGWPTRRAVGQQAAHDALLLLRRSTDTAFQEATLPAVAAAGQDDSPEYAQFVDMVATRDGEPQTYGTQWACRNNAMAPATPIRDRDGLNARRAKVHLPPYELEMRDVGRELGGCGFVEAPPPVDREPGEPVQKFRVIVPTIPTSTTTTLNR
jgi:hypothetical protein